MNDIPCRAEGTDWALTHYELVQHKRDRCEDTIYILQNCTSLAEAICVFKKRKQDYNNEIKEYDISAALNHSYFIVQEVSYFLEKLKLELNSLDDNVGKIFREDKRGLPDCRRLWESVTETMGWPRLIPSTFFFHVNERVFCEKMYDCEGRFVKHIFKMVTKIDIVLNIFQFVSDCSWYIPKVLSSVDREHLVQCSCCYTKRMDEKIRKTNNPKMRRFWDNMTIPFPFDLPDNPCTREYTSADCPPSPAYSPTSPTFTPTPF